jgi:hypothetical protein
VRKTSAICAVTEREVSYGDDAPEDPRNVSNFDGELLEPSRDL